LPLAAFAGLRVRRLDETGAEVSLPAGWKTQNPFGSTYFAAQAMAAEMSTGAPMLWFIEQSGVKVSSLVTNISAKFTKKAVSEARFVFKDGAAMRAAISEAVVTGEPRTFTARSVGTQRDGSEVAEFEVTWSFKKKQR
ncbi:MAG TPA: DUF4442 domain-containing protein, partial [Myxococcales bacterium]|nr:DUF4442 domain-containing protein [Myxococcales bacterium]